MRLGASPCVSAVCFRVRLCSAALAGKGFWSPGLEEQHLLSFLPPGKGIPAHSRGAWGQMRNAEAARGISDGRSQSWEKQSQGS